VIGASGGPHENSHHSNNPEKMNKVEAITRFHVSVYSKLLQKMHAVKEGNKTLLDNSLVLLGSDLWDGNTHKTHQKPIIVAGKGDGNVKTGSHIVHNQGTPLNNLYLGMMKTAGCPVKKFGDSEGTII
jgi:hypothetical protein